MNKEINPVDKPYKLFLSESYGPIYESITRNIPLTERTSLRLVDRTIGDLVSRKYEFILDCIKKYEDYIRERATRGTGKRWDSYIRDYPNLSTDKKLRIIYPSSKELNNQQLFEQHFSWSVFLHCVSTISLTDKQLEELSSVFLQDDFIKLKVQIYDVDDSDQYILNSDKLPVFLHQGYSQKYLVLRIIIDRNMSNLDKLDKVLFNILVEI